jgi:cell cycle checkpoint protein
MISIPNPFIDPDPDSDLLAQKFHRFITRASACPALSTPHHARRVILLEDLPNILHQPTQHAFHIALDSIIASPSSSLTLVVIIVSDAGVRGEDPDDAPSPGRKAHGIVGIPCAMSVRGCLQLEAGHGA